MSSASTPIRPPRQERSRRTLQRILATSRELFSQGDPRDVSMREIADAAEVSISSLYARFPNKDTLLEHLHTELCEQRLADTEDVVETLEREESTLEGVVDRSLRILLDRSAQRGGLERAFEFAATQHEGIRLREERFQRQRLRRLRVFVRELLRETESSASDEKIDSIVGLALNAGPGLCGRGATNPTARDVDAMVRELADLLVSGAGVTVEQRRSPRKAARPAVPVSSAGADRLMDAGVELIDGHLLSQLPVHEIERRAGLSEGSFENHFEDPSAFLHALLDRTARFYVSETDRLAEWSQWEDRTFADLVRAVIERYGDFWMKHGGFIRTLRAAEDTDAALAEHHRQLDRDVEERIVALCLLVEPSLGETEDKRRTFVQHMEIFAASIRTAVDRPSVFRLPDASSRDELVDHFLPLFLQALGTRNG